MAIFGKRIQRILKDSVQHFIIALVIFALAIGLSFVHDLCEKWNRPEWLIFGITIIEAFLLVVDGVVLCSIVVIVGMRSIAEFARQTGEQDD